VTYSNESVFVSCIGNFGLICLLNILEHGTPKLDVDISSNPFNCDCKDFDIIGVSRHFGDSHMLDRGNCGQPPSLYKQKVARYFSYILTRYFY